MALNVEVTEKQSGVFLISPVGSIDTDTYELLENRINSILGISPKAIIFDMEGVSYITSAGVGVILKVQSSLGHHGGILTMINLQPQIKKVFDILKVVPSEQIFTSIEELDSYLDEIQHKHTKKQNPPD